MTQNFVDVAIALGSNLGDRAQFLRMAFAAVATLPGVCKLRGSFLYETPPWGAEAQAFAQSDYLNAVLSAQTTLTPDALLDALLAIERGAGRERGALRHAPRTLDLDLLFYGQSIRNDPHLTLPHPRLAERAFVLVPLCDLEPGWVHPVLGKTATELLEGLPECGLMRRVGELIP